jgi:hypothetical protein
MMTRARWRRATDTARSARRATYYASMVDGAALHGEYLTLADIADRMSWTIKTARTMQNRANRRRAAGASRPGDLPKEDHRVGRIPLWLTTTIEHWERDRPGRGTGGGPKPRT